MSQGSLTATLDTEALTKESRDFIRQVRRVVRCKYTPEKKICIVLEGCGCQIYLY